MAGETDADESIKVQFVTSLGVVSLLKFAMKKILPRHRIALQSLFFLIAAILFAGCYEPKEGCLDIDATNYNVEADDACPDCCTYPALTIVPLHQILVKNTLDSFINFNYKVFYPSPTDQDSFQVQRSRFFISNLKLVNLEGEAVGVDDTIGIVFGNGSRVVYEDNFSKLDRDIFSASAIGTFLADGVYDKLTFTLGLPEELLSLDTASIPANHPLDPRKDTIVYQEGIGYIPNILIFKTDTAAAAVPVELHFFQPVEIQLPLSPPLEIKRGFNIKIRLRINYAAWFEGVDFQHDSEDVMKQKIAANLPNAFWVTEIIFE